MHPAPRSPVHASPWKWLGPIALGIVGVLGTGSAAADEAAKATFALAERPEIRDVGVPVHSVNWVRLFAGRNRAAQPCIYASMGQTADNLFVLQIDPETGKLRQHVAKVSSANFPTAALMSRSGKLYVGAAYAGHLLRFDPEKDALEDLGAIHPGAATFPCGIDEDAEGRLWIGSYPSADLTCFDPRTGQFQRFGRMDDVDMYNYPMVAADGKIGNLIRMVQQHVLVFDPATGEKKTAGPVVTKGGGSVAQAKGPDGKLYVVSSEGTFRVDGMDAVKVDSVPSAPAAAKSEPPMTFAFTDAEEQIHRKLEVHAPDGAVRAFDLDYEAAGSEIFCLHAGPDGCVYGSSYLPLHLFRYHPGEDKLVDLGRCSSAAGEAYSMANLDGKIIISSYPAAVVSVYDPAKPYRFGVDPDANPRDVGRVDDISYRPHATLGGPAGRAWLASVPDYGRWGGPLSYYCPATGEKKAYYRIVGDASCSSLAYLESEGLIAVGTSIHGGSGTRPKVDQAVLFLWDHKKEEKVWEGTPDRPVETFNALVAGPDGRLYGTIVGGGAELFVLDPKQRKFVGRVGLPGTPLNLGLQNGPDGRIWGVTSSSIYRVEPSTLGIDVVVKAKETFTVAGPIVGTDLYVAHGHRLQAARIFSTAQASEPQP
jgi:streptogramin lyase